MKRYSVARARANLAEALDLAEQGEAVIIERRGVRFLVQPETSPPKRRKAKASRIEILDTAVEAGQWSWKWSEDGLEFTRPRLRRPPRKARS